MWNSMRLISSGLWRKTTLQTDGRKLAENAKYCIIGFVIKSKYIMLYILKHWCSLITVMLYVRNLHVQMFKLLVMPSVVSRSNQHDAVGISANDTQGVLNMVIIIKTKHIFVPAQQQQRKKILSFRHLRGKFYMRLYERNNQ